MYAKIMEKPRLCYKRDCAAVFSHIYQFSVYSSNISSNNKLNGEQCVCKSY